MGLLDKLRNELVDIIEWLDDDRHTLVWRFPRYQNEIKQGAELIVRPGQVAIFVSQGQLADIFEPGRYQLETGNLPILSTIMGWKHGFNSPFRSEVYFVSTRQVTDLKWGTPNPIMLRDPEFGPIRLRAFGTYTLKAADPKALLEELVGTDREFDAGEITELLRSFINNGFADLIGESKVAALDLASNYEEFAQQLRDRVVQKIDDEYGLDIPQLMIVNISFPEAVEKALDQRTSMGVIGDMQKFQQMQMGNAILAAAENPGGGAASAGMGLGVGVAMGQQMMGAGNANAGGAAAQPPPPPPQQLWHITVDGATQGPFTMAQIQSGVSAGQVTKDTLVWTQGMGGWTAASQVPALAGLFPPPPPPAPPAPPQPPKG